MALKPVRAAATRRTMSSSAKAAPEREWLDDAVYPQRRRWSSVGARSPLRLTSTFGLASAGRQKSSTSISCDQYGLALEACVEAAHARSVGNREYDYIES